MNKHNLTSGLIFATTIAVVGFLTVSGAVQVLATSTNQTPTLSYSQEAGYVNDGINPDNGGSSTNFTFKIVYTDADNDPPTDIRTIVFSGDSSTATADTPEPEFSSDIMVLDTSAAAQLRDGNYVNGEQFILAKSFPAGTYRYRFQASFPEVNGAAGMIFDGIAGGKAQRFEATESEVNNGRIPVIIIPGILGSQLFKEQVGLDDLIWLDQVNVFFSEKDDFLNELVVDSNGKSTQPIIIGELLRQLPRANYYDNLVKNIEGGGYEENSNLFTFPYDWRLDNRESAEKLKSKIDEVLSQTNNKKVDVVAHSMGGIVFRDYVAKFGSEKINKIIYIATPQLGSPKVFNALAFDYALNNLFFPVQYLNNQTLSNVGKTMPSVYQLLPREPFITLNQDNLLPLNETYVQEKDGRPFMSTFHIDRYYQIGNEIFGDQNIKNIPQYTIVGSGNATLGGLNGVLLKNDPDICWFPVVTNGDETVPVMSAREEYGNQSKIIYTNVATHSELPNNAAVGDMMVQILKDEPLKDDRGRYIVSGFSDSPFASHNTIVWNTCSPVRTEIVDSEGNRNGLDERGNLDSNIPASSFFPLRENEGGFLPADGSYMLKLTAFDSGSFSLHTSVVNDEGNTILEQNFNDILIANSSIATIQMQQGTTSILSLDVEGDGESDFTIMPNNSSDPELSFRIIKRFVTTLNAEERWKRQILVELTVAEKLTAKGNVLAAKTVLNNLLRHIEKITSKGELSLGIADALTKMIQKIELSI